MAHKTGAKKLRLWGKIIGSQKDYYIAEGEADGGEEPEDLPAEVERRGNGANILTHWVTNDCIL